MTAPGRHAYQRNHGKVRRVRGSAKNATCTDCGSPAQQWSQIHGTSGTDPFTDFEPRCTKCHLTYDGRTRWTAFTAVADDIATRIGRGELGGKLPAAASLAAHYGCAPGTVRKALYLLHTRGQLVIMRSRGAYAAAMRAYPTDQHKPVT